MRYILTGRASLRVGYEASWANVKTLTMNPPERVGRSSNEMDSKSCATRIKRLINEGQPRCEQGKIVVVGSKRGTPPGTCAFTGRSCSRPVGQSVT